jgi:membrane fusion protein, peptide pheromone/bacteriocin exporter
MATKRLLPAERADGLVECYLARHSGSSRAIYLFVLLLVVVALSLLPVLRVNVSSVSPGIIRPATERHEIRARHSGIVSQVLITGGAKVTSGEPLVLLNTTTIDEQVQLLERQIAERDRLIRDLEVLTGGGSVPSLPPIGLRAAELQREHGHLLFELAEFRMREDAARTVLERTKALFSRQLAPRSDLEEQELALEQIRSAAALRTQRQLASWQARLASLRLEQVEARSRRDQIAEERALFRVDAPVTGTVEELASLSPGSFVQAGERVAVVSPDDELIAEMWVTPRDIGLLSTGMPVRLHVDAFNHRDWGYLPGRVREIASDFQLVDQRPAFRVRVALDGTSLTLRTGLRGEVKKGMTVQARFLLAERTLLQLVRDNVGDWLAPSAGRVNAHTQQ